MLFFFIKDIVQLKHCTNRLLSKQSFTKLRLMLFDSSRINPSVETKYYLENIWLRFHSSGKGSNSLTSRIPLRAIVDMSFLTYTLNKKKVQAPYTFKFFLLPLHLPLVIVKGGVCVQKRKDSRDQLGAGK